MSWERDPLLAKAKLFFFQAFQNSDDDSLFGLWCSLGLELLARAAVASVSPTLLAEPDNDHRNLLHALNRGSEKYPRRSIDTSRVLALCKTLFSVALSEDDLKIASALFSRRNEEMHTGTAAFEEYNRQQWLLGFYEMCRGLGTALGESLEDLLGSEHGKEAVNLLQDNRQEVKHQVQSALAAHKRVWQSKSQDEQDTERTSAKNHVTALRTQRHHKVPCPACGCAATLQGDTYGPEHTENQEDRIVITQSVIPRTFGCIACGLKLNTYSELTEAHLGAHYTRTTTFAPEDYFGIETFEEMSTAEILSRLDLSEIMDHVERETKEYDNE